MSDLTHLTMAAALEGLAAKKFSSRELTDAYLAKMAQHRDLNAYITETPDRARAMADAADRRRGKGEAKGLMEGLPLAIKDLFCTEDVLSTAGSHILDGFKPAYESTVTGNLWKHGAVMLGKLNMDEFAMGSSNGTSYYGSVTNPWKRKDSDVKLVPGGSSGGSAAAVSARRAIAPPGTDTGGPNPPPFPLPRPPPLKPTLRRL